MQKLIVPDIGGQDASGSRRHDQLQTPGTVQSASRHGVEPRILDPYGSPHQHQVNPFWSEGLQRSVRGHDDRPAVAGNDGSSGFDAEIEKLKEKCLRDAEEPFAREVKKLGLGEKTEAESYHTASSSMGAQNAKAPNGSDGSRPDGLPHGAAQGPEPPTGLASARIGFDGTAGPAVSESLRHLELPRLPVVGSEGAALQFGDWLTMATPLMSDLGSLSKVWWERTLEVAEDFYGRWLEPTPLERLRLKPTVEVDPVYMRLEQRGISMLLRILPEAVRRDIVGARNVSTVSILYRLFVGAERTLLLKSLTEVRVGTTLHDVLRTIRLWRRWVGRALELSVTVPDSLILMQVLGKMSDAVGKLGGAQASY